MQNVYRESRSECISRMQRPYIQARACGGGSCARKGLNRRRHVLPQIDFVPLAYMIGKRKRAAHISSSFFVESYISPICWKISHAFNRIISKRFISVILAWRKFYSFGCDFLLVFISTFWRRPIPYVKVLRRWRVSVSSFVPNFYEHLSASHALRLSIHRS